VVKLQVYVPDEVAAEMDARRGLGTRSAFAKAMMIRGMELDAGTQPRAATPVPEKRPMPKLRGAGGAR
jgi:hypothetical protein